MLGVHTLWFIHSLLSHHRGSPSFRRLRSHGGRGVPPSKLCWQCSRAAGAKAPLGFSDSRRYHYNSRPIHLRKLKSTAQRCTEHLLHPGAALCIEYNDSNEWAMGNKTEISCPSKRYIRVTQTKRKSKQKHKF